MSSTLLPQDLPGVLGDIAEVAGVSAALQVAAARGGRVAYIPTPDHLPPEHWLVVAVGAEAAAAIARRLGGGALLIPLGPLGGTRGRVWATIRAAIDEGCSAPEAAARAGVHERTVRRHRNRRDDEDQGKLF
ncbi:conserved hypothetical protein [uncultured Alphaproteobacteria bacterium]|uniref:Helix-turn-helix domain-containing protein n=1 Tax=uncultured Alphaproteobacteria bacterium TaxID=91750 RepID=A0A212KMY8_9PROT|nr:conserved hypothetical protein [uncultured Alphaproteobacteria bacterium]